MAAYNVVERNMLIDEANPGIAFLGWYDVYADVGSARHRFMEAAPLEGLSDKGTLSQQIITGLSRESSAKIFDVSGGSRATGGRTFHRY